MQFECMKQKDKEKKYKIYVCYHKKAKIFKNDIFQPIHCGTDLSNISIPNTIKDNEGENISKKNKNYCELTALYWIWKNVKDVDYIGLAHYRRLFDLLGKYNSIEYDKDIKYSKNELEKMKLFIDKFDIILPTQISFKNDYTIKEQYSKSHNGSDLNVIAKIIKDLYPNYLESYYECLNQRKGSYYNMFIMKKDICLEYCEWLFNILFQANKEIKIPNDTYQARIFGFLSERLLNVFVHHKMKNDPNINICFSNVTFLREISLIRYIFIKIFSVKNLYNADKKYKIITILGIKFKIKVKNNKPKTLAAVERESNKPNGL